MRGALLACALLLASGCAKSGPPTDAQLARVEALWGFEAAVTELVDVGFVRGAPASVPTAQRTCLRDQVARLLTDNLRTLVRSRITFAQHADDIIEFGASPGGARLMRALREGLMMRARGQTPPPVERTLDALTASEQRDVRRFIHSSAGETMMRAVPTGAELVAPMTPAARDAALAACGIRG